MDISKLMLTMLMIFLVVACTAGSAFAGANIAVSFNTTTAKVGDQVSMIVTVTNTGPGDLSNVNVSASLPAGLKFMTSATGTTKNQYNSSTGLWQVDNLKMSSQGGGKKTLTVTAEVQSAAAGKTLNANVAFLSVFNGTPPVSISLKSAQSQLTVSAIETGTGNNTGTGTTGTSTTSTTSSSSVSSSNGTPTKTSQIIAQLKENNTGDNPLNLPQQTPQKAYDVFNSTENSNTPVPMSTYAIVALVGIGVLVALGYFFGIRK